MKYLFFDIECANCDGGNGKMCSFGYVKADENLQITENEDIIINPKAPFRLRGYGSRCYIQLAYPEAVFKKAPAFPNYYEKIKALLTEPDTLIFGYAPENDAGFLRSEFERYALPSVNFVFYDVQRIFKKCIPSETGNLPSLASACEQLSVTIDQTTHKSSDDALATMLILKKLCEKTLASPKELIEKHPICKGELENGMVKANYFKPKAELSPQEKNMIKGENKVKFRNLIRRLSGFSYGIRKKRVCLSWLYEFYHFKEACVLVSVLSEHGYKYTHKLHECDVFVKKPEASGGTCKRFQEVRQINENSTAKKIEIIEFDEFLALIDLDGSLLLKKAAEFEI